jgi:hypothetical protein
MTNTGKVLPLRRLVLARLDLQLLRSNLWLAEPKTNYRVVAVGEVMLFLLKAKKHQSDPQVKRCLLLFHRAITLACQATSIDLSTVRPRLILKQTNNAVVVQLIKMFKLKKIQLGGINRFSIKMLTKLNKLVQPQLPTSTSNIRAGRRDSSLHTPNLKKPI